MSTNTTRAEKRSGCSPESLAQQHCHDAQLLGIDSDGDRHYWSIYHQSVIVVRGEEATVIDLPTKHAPTDTPILQLPDWVALHRQTTGWRELRYERRLFAEVRE